MKNYILPLVLVFVCLSLTAQDQPLLNQYLQAPSYYNPSMAGFKEETNISLIRNQKWAGYQNGYISNILSADTRMGKNGIGVQLGLNQAGILSNTSINANYAYHLKINEDTRLGFGFALGLIDQRVDFNAVQVVNADDPDLFLNLENQLGLDANFGLNFQIKDFLIGVSVPQLAAWNFSYTNSNNETLNIYQSVRNIHALLKYDISLSESVKLSPFGYVRYVQGTPIQYDGGLSFMFKNLFWADVIYRSNYAITGNIGLCISKTVKVGYSYDYVINSTSGQTGVNQEFLIGITIPNKKKSKEDNLLKQKQDEINKLKDSLKNIKADTVVIYDTVVVTEKVDTLVQQALDSLDKHIRYNKDDDIIDLDGNKVQKGYYIINGVFSSKKNAIKAIGRINKELSETKAAINRRNDMFYVILGYSESKQEVALKLEKVFELGYGDSWVLDFSK